MSERRQWERARIVLLHWSRRKWTEVDPVLLAGEAAVSNAGTSPDLRIGDGKRRWSQLPRFVPEKEDAT